MRKSENGITIDATKKSASPEPVEGLSLSNPEPVES